MATDTTRAINSLKRRSGATRRAAAWRGSTSKLSHDLLAGKLIRPEPLHGGVVVFGRFHDGLGSPWVEVVRVTRTRYVAADRGGFIEPIERKRLIARFGPEPR